MKYKIWKECVLCGLEFMTKDKEVCQPCQQTKKYLDWKSGRSIINKEYERKISLGNKK